MQNERMAAIIEYGKGRNQSISSESMLNEEHLKASPINAKIFLAEASEQGHIERTWKLVLPPPLFQTVQKRLKGGVPIYDTIN